jgi:putative ABC transport system substrate-binding protein
MKRREFITLLGGAAAWPLIAHAQQLAMPLIGALFAVSAAEWEDFMAGFRRGLSESGFVEGQNVAVISIRCRRWRPISSAVTLPSSSREAPSASGRRWLPLKPLLSFSRVGVDPIAAGFVASLNRPSGNVTGVTLISSELAPKRLELLRELVTTATKIALLVNPNNPASPKAGNTGRRGRRPPPR